MSEVPQVRCRVTITRAWWCCAPRCWAVPAADGWLPLLRKALMGDTLSHATLPAWRSPSCCRCSWGWQVAAAVTGRGNLTGVTGCMTVLWIRNHSRIKDDAAMGIVLSVFFGAGVVLLGFIQNMPQGSAAGLESFIYGKTASMVRSDFDLLMGVTLAVLLLSVLLFKEFRLVCFDEAYAAAQGWPVRLLDLLLLALVTAVTVAGLQAVGLILIIAFLITPAAAARFWTERLDRMLLLAALIGGLSGWLAQSALMPRLPAGAVIVLVAAAVFLPSRASAALSALRQRHFAAPDRASALLRAS